MADGAFEDRVALVTGASGGIGAALCRALAADGAVVAAAYGRGAASAEQVVAELSERGAAASAFGADLEDPVAPGRLIDAVERELGAVDLLVANHGLGNRVNYEELDAAGFDQMMAINLRAPFLLAQRVLPGMREQGFGRILFVSSVAAFRGGVIGPHYAASKAGLHGLAYFLASRTASDGVTVNVIAPGFIETEMLPDDPTKLAGSVPVGRLGQPEEVAELAVSILRNGYLTAHVIPLDGGMHPR